MSWIDMNEAPSSEFDDKLAQKHSSSRFESALSHRKDEVISSLSEPSLNTLQKRKTSVEKSSIDEESVSWYSLILPMSLRNRVAWNKNVFHELNKHQVSPEKVQNTSIFQAIFTNSILLRK